MSIHDWMIGPTITRELERAEALELAITPTGAMVVVAVGEEIAFGIEVVEKAVVLEGPFELLEIEPGDAVEEADPEDKEADPEIELELPEDCDVELELCELEPEVLERVPLVNPPTDNEELDVWVLELEELERLVLETLPRLDAPVDADEFEIEELDTVELEELPVLGTPVERVEFEERVLALCEDVESPPVPMMVEVVKLPVPTMEDEELLELPEVDPPCADEEEFVNVPAELELKDAVDMPVPDVLDLTPVESIPVVEEELPEGKGTEEDWLLDELPDEVEVCGASQV